MALGDRQAGPERRAEHGGRVLADTAAPLQLGALADHGVATKAIAVLAELGVERELAAGRDEHAIEARRAGLDVGDPVGGREPAKLLRPSPTSSAIPRLGSVFAVTCGVQFCTGRAISRLGRRRAAVIAATASDCLSRQPVWPGWVILGLPRNATRLGAAGVDQLRQLLDGPASRSGSTSTVIVPRSALIASSSASLLGCHAQLCSARRSTSRTGQQRARVVDRLGHARR